MTSEIPTPEYVPLKYILPITSIGIVISAMDGSIVNVSLKTIADDMNTNMEGVRWIVITYLLVISVLMGISGSFGDIYGRKKVFQLGMLIFVIGSSLCSLSTSLSLLIAARIFQAVGASGIMANGLAIVITYIDPYKRGRAIGINTLVVASSLAAGPVIGGILTQYYGWQSIFYINIPIGLIGILATQFVIKETTQNTGVKLDVKGMILFAYTAFSFIAGLMALFQGYYLATILIFSSFLSAFLFYKNEDSHTNPIFPVEVMKDRQIMMGILSAVLAYMTIYSLIFLFPFYLQEVLDFDQSTTGMYMSIIPLSFIVTGPPTGFLAEKISAKKLATLGSTLLSFFLYILGFSFLYLGSKLTIVALLIMIGITAASLTIFTNSNSTSVMNAAPKSKISMVSGTLNLSRNVGFIFGTALSTTFFSFAFTYFNPKDYTTGKVFEEAYYNGLGVAFIIFATVNILGIILSYSRGEERVVLT
ncbi:MAG: MFS transporter [Candidatus Kariarchaeaceae archaeon]|jgi:EmrB/QacA subfamily drug resistance transporter